MDYGLVVVLGRRRGLQTYDATLKHNLSGRREVRRSPHLGEVNFSFGSASISGHSRVGLLSVCLKISAMELESSQRGSSQVSEVGVDERIDCWPEK